MSPVNIAPAYETTGNQPFGRYVFTVQGLLPSVITDTSLYSLQKSSLSSCKILPINKDIPF